MPLPMQPPLRDAELKVLWDAFAAIEQCVKRGEPERLGDDELASADVQFGAIRRRVELQVPGERRPDHLLPHERALVIKAARWYISQLGIEHDPDLGAKAVILKQVIAACENAS